jgi:hypothetical protein
MHYAHLHVNNRSVPATVKAKLCRIEIDYRLTRSDPLYTTIRLNRPPNRLMSVSKPDWVRRYPVTKGLHRIIRQERQAAVGAHPRQTSPAAAGLALPDLREHRPIDVDPL